MKIWGIVEELEKLIFRKNSRQITLEPNDGSYTGAVEIKLPPKLSAGAAVLVAEDVEQTLTNKVFSNGVIRDNARLVNLEVRNELDAAGNPTLKFYNDGGAYKISMFAPPGLGDDYNFSLPNGPGTANYVMRTNGAGVTSWSQIVDASISDSAAISFSKLASLTSGNILVGNASNVPTPVSVTGDVTISNAGVTAIAAGAIVNADINANAAIDDTKLATISTAGKVANTATTATDLNTASAIVARDASGNFSAGTITSQGLDLSGTGRRITGDFSNASPANRVVIQTSTANSQTAVQAAPNGTSTLSQFVATNVSDLSQPHNTAQLASLATEASLRAGVALGASALPLTFYTNSQEQVRVTSAGNVGIGTTTPATKLDVNGTITATSYTGPSTAVNGLLPSQTGSANKYLKTDGSGTLSWASASGGAGEINAVLNSSGADGTTGWTGTSVVTGSNSPLNPIVTTAFSISNAATTESSTSGGYYPFTLPTGLQNRKLKVEFSYTTPATDVYKVSVYKGSTRVALTTDVIGSTSLPASVTGGKFTAYFDTDGSSSWTVSITRTSGSTGPIYVTNVIVGPGIQPQGAVVGEWETSTTPAGGWFITGPTNVSTAVNQMRIGRDAHLRYAVQATGTSAAFTELKIKLPANISIDTTALNKSSSGRAPLGRFEITKPGVGNYTGIAYYETDGTIYCRYITSTEPSSVTNTTPLAWNTTTGNTSINIDITVPIAEWAGSGTVQLAQNDVEYASNNGSGGTAADNNYTTGAVYGPAGSSIPAVTISSGTATTVTGYKVSFQSPIQVGDKIDVEVSLDSGATWGTLGTLGNGSLASMWQGDVLVGMTWAHIDSTSIYVYFSNAGRFSTAAYGTASGTWSSGPTTAWRWRVRKSSAGAAVGFGLYQPGVSAGLVSSSGLAGRANGTVVPTGFVGEKVDWGGLLTTSNITATGQEVGNGTARITLQPGIYLVSYSGDVAGSDSTVQSTLVLGTVSGTATITNIGQYFSSVQGDSSGTFYGFTGLNYVIVSSAAVIRVVSEVLNGGTLSSCRLIKGAAIRIA